MKWPGKLEMRGGGSGGMGDSGVLDNSTSTSRRDPGQGIAALQGGIPEERCRSPRTPLLSRGDTFLHEETLRNMFGALSPRGGEGGGG